MSPSATTGSDRREPTLVPGSPGDPDGPATTAVTPPPPAAPGPNHKPLWRRILKWLGVTLLVLVLLLAIALGGLWWWSGTAGSLATGLTQAGKYMPQGMVLESSGVSGPLREGGRIESLHFQGPTIDVRIDGLDLGWQLGALLDRKVQLKPLHIEKIRLEPRTPADPPPEKPSEPLTQLVLPVEVDLPFRVDEIVWAGPPETVVSGLAGRYQYKDAHHLLDVDGVDVMDGHYGAKVKLQGAAPMALQAALKASVRVPMPEGTEPLSVDADVTIDGTLSAPGARLTIAAKASSQAAADAAVKPLRATVDAVIAPWAKQPVVSAKADFENVDVGRLVPKAPATDLSGQITAGPQPKQAPDTPIAEARWQAQVAITNAKPGPYDKQLVPVERIEADARYDGTRVELPKALIELAGGRIEAAGSWAPAPEPWQAKLTITDVIPARLDTQLDAAPINGTAVASQDGEAIVFDVALKTDAAKAKTAKRSSATGGFRVDQVLVKGSFAGQTLELTTLRIDAENAQVEGQLKAQLDKLSGHGKLDLELPGVKANIDADMGPEQGKASIKMNLQDAARVQRWAEGLPGLSDVFAGAAVDGSATLDADWQGGWKVAQRLVETGKPEAGKPLNIDLSLNVPKLDLKLPATAPAAKATAETKAGKPADAKPESAASAPKGVPPAQPKLPGTPGIRKAAAPAPKPASKPKAAAAAGPAQTVQLRDLKLKLAGSPAAADLALDGQVTLGTQKIDLSTRANGGLAAKDRLRVAIEKLRLQASDSAKPKLSPWIVQLEHAFEATLRLPTATKAGAPGLLALDANAGGLTVKGPAPGTVKVNWEPIAFAQTAPAAEGKSAPFRLQSKGALSGIPLGWAEALAGGDIGVKGDLVFDGNWDIAIDKALKAQIRLGRSSGDLRVQTGAGGLVRRIESTGTGTKAETEIDRGGKAAGTTPAGLRKLELTVDANGDTVNANFDWDSERAGQISAKAKTRLEARDGGWALPENPPLDVQLKADMPDVGVWSLLAPPGWRIQGALKADAAISGSLDAPQWRGTLSADGLSVKAAVEGIDLRDGRLRAQLEGNKLVLQEFRLEGGPANGARIGGQSGNISTVESEQALGGGSIVAKGTVQWSAPTPTASNIQMAIGVEIDRLRVLARTDRQASVSGKIDLGLKDGQITVGGKARIDRAVIILPDGTAPTLDSDVVVTSAAIRKEAAEKAAKENDKADAAAKAEAADDAARAGAPKVKTAKPPDISVELDLGDDFAVQGQGITTRLEGELQIRSSAATGGQLRITGEVRTVKGQYRAYGQELDVEKGIVRFNGPPANPQLDMLAVRPNIGVRAGVRITGPASAPRVRLYSDPPLPDAEVLSYVVLGRSTASGGAEALVMQQAALALIGGLSPGGGGGNLASRFGLDEIGFKGPSSGGSAQDSAITLGKRLSKDVYLSYERSLSGALGTLYIFYELTKRLQLRAETGTTSGLDIIYTIKFD